MRKKNYTFLKSTESVVTNSFTTNPPEAKVSNIKSRLFVKWFLAMFILAFSFSVNAQISVTSSGGTGSGTPLTHTTLKSAFDSINNGYYTGVIAISVTSSTTEIATASLNSSATGSASYTSINIKPAASTTPTIGGTINGALIKFAGADNVTIDGSNNGTSSRDLTILNSSTGGSVVGIWVGSISGNGATSNTIKNCNLTQSSTVNNFACIISGSSTSLGGASPTPNSNNTYTNNRVGRANYNILLLGTTASPDVNVSISKNNVDSAFLNGIYCSAQSGFNIFNNTFNVANTAAATTQVHGIQVLNGSLNGNIYNNNIAKVYQYSTASSARGITLNSSAASPNIAVFNNFIGDVWAVGISNSFSCYGINCASVNGGYKFYNNTFNLTSSLSNSSAVTAALFISGPTLANSIDIRNNIFRCVANGGGNAYALACLSAVNVLSNCDYNSYYSHLANINVYTASQTAASTIPAIQALTGKDVNSVILNPTFVSSTDYHLQSVAANASLSNAGTFIASVTTDFDGDTRSTNAPDIGADEFIYIPKITSFSPSSACPGATVTINGADFTGATAVSLAGLNASYTVVSTSQITATVSNSTNPSNSTVSVTNSFGTGTSTGTLDRKSPGTYTSKSISTGSTGDQVTISGTNLSGATAVTFGGTTATFTITNSTEVVATVPSISNGTVSIAITDACGNSVSAGSFTVVTANPCTTPSAQATSFVASSTTTSTLNGTFSFASGSPSGYLVVYATSALSGVPQNGTTYTAGAGFSGTILQVSSSSSVSITGLTGNTTYTVTVFAYNGGGCSGGPLYNTTNPLTYTFTTCSNIPTSVTATPVGNSTGNSINFAWGAPSGGGANSVTYSLEVTTDAAYSSPVSGSPFSINQLSKSVSGLNFNTKYYYRIRSNNGCYSSYVTGNVTTGCGAVNVPVYQNFDATISSALPTCWLVEDANGDGITWTSSNIDSRVSGLTNPRALRYSANSTTTTVAANDWAFMPGVQLVAGQSYTLSFLQNALTNGGENLQIYYGASQSSAIKTNANKIFDAAGLSNTAAVLQAATFTPPTTGTYYVGFYCNSPSSAQGGLFLFLDEITLDVTPAAPAAPAPVTASIPTAYSLQVNWTDNSSTELGYNVYSSLNGTDWVYRTSTGANVTNTLIGNLKASTAYYFKVEAYNAGGSNSATTSTSTSTSSCSGYTTNSYIGTLFTGTGNNWLNSSNWSLGHTPNACEDVQINAAVPITTTCYLYLKSPVAIHNLDINQTLTGTAVQTLFVFTQSNSFDISGNATVAVNRTASTTVTGDAVYLVSGPGVITVEGKVSMGETGNRTAALGTGGSTLGPIYLKGDVVFGPQSFLNFGNLINFVFDAPVSQTVTLNSSATSANPATYGLGNVQIGSSNTPTVTFTDTMTTNSQMAGIVNDFIISNGASVIIANGTQLNRTQSGSGTFSLGSNSSLTLSGATGGVGNSNFPSGFANYTFDNASTVLYNGTAAQTISSALTYGNLTLNNANGATINGNTTVNNFLTLTNGKIATGSNKLTLGLSAAIANANSSNYINGTLEKTIGSATSSKSFEIGDASNYTPVSMSFVGGSTNSGGKVSAKTTAGAPAALGYLRSGISLTNYLARKYTLSNSGVTGFTSITPTFNYVSGNLVGNTSNANYLIADSVYGGGWSLRSATTNPSATSSSSTGISLSTGASTDVLIGELDPPPAPTVNEPNPTSACEGSVYTITGTNFYGINSVTIGSASCVFTVNSSTQLTITIPTAIPSGVITVTNGGGSASTSGSLNTLDQPITTASPSTQTVCSGDAITTIVLGNSNSVAGTTYSWTRTGNNAAVSGATTGTNSISGSFASTSTISETLTYTANATGGNGCAGIATTATVVVKASPGVVSLSPTSSSICQNGVQQLTANYTAATGNQTTGSGAISVSIPDGTGTNGVNGLGGVNTDLIMNSVPTGALVTKVEVGMKITHTFTGDLGINVKAPNGKILNLAFLAGDATDNYGDVNNYAVFSSDADPNTQFLPADSTPGGIVGVYAPDANNNVGTPAFKSNTTLFSDLFSTPNGTWKLIARDYGAGDTGAIKNWYVKVYYTLQPTFVWAPTAGLYLNAGHTSAYTGGSQQSVYAYNTPGNYSYSANISFNGCTASSTSATVDIQAIPTASRSIASQTVCSGTSISDIVLSSPNDNTAILSWTRDHTSDISGTIGASGTGDVSGNLVNTTAAPITVTFTITANGSGSQSCAGSSVTSTVTVNPTPLATASPAAQNICSGSAINPITLGTTNSVSGTTYTWSRNNTSAATGIAASGNSFISGTLTNASSTTTVTFSVTAVGPGSSACAGTPATATVTVYNPATVYNVTGGGSYCSFPGDGVPVGLSNSQSGYTYQLVTGSTSSSISGTGSVLSYGNQTAAGTYTITASNAGCSTPMNGSATVSVITTLTPSVSLQSSSTTACAGTNVAFFATATNGGTNPTYNFFVNNVSKQNGSSNAYLTTLLQNGDVIYCVMTTSNVCQTASTSNSNSIQMTITAGATLAAPKAITGTTTNCTVGTSNFLKDSTTGGAWSSSDTTVAKINVSGLVNTFKNGSTVISYRIYGSNGCSNSSSVVYVVAEQTVPAAITSAGSITSLCIGATLQLSDATSGGVWGSANNAASVNASTGLVTGTYGAGTSYPAVILYKLSNVYGCSKTVTKNLTVNPIPGVPGMQYAAGTPNPQNGPGGGYCLNRSGIPNKFVVVGYPATGSGSGTSHWTSSVPGVLTATDSTGTLAVIQLAAFGTSTIKYAFTNANGCSNSRSVTLTVVNCPNSRGVQQIESQTEVDFTLSPNPAKGSVTIVTQYVQSGGQIIVTDLFGKQVKVQTLSLGSNKLDISNLSKGLYLVNIITNEGKKTKKLIVE